MALLSEHKITTTIQIQAKSKRLCILLTVFLLAFVLYNNTSYCQKVVAPNNKGTVIGTQNNDNRIVKETKIYYKVTPENTDKILLANKYLNVSKDICILLGTDTVGFVTKKDLQNGKTFLPFEKNVLIIGEKTGLIKLRLDSGILKITTKVYTIDRTYTAMVIDNELITSDPNFHQIITDHSFEVYDKYFVPALQIELRKKVNAIYIGGVFFFKKSYIIANEKGMDVSNYEIPFMNMTPARRDSILSEVLDSAENVKPLKIK
jgi:hypothetical protein